MCAAVAVGIAQSAAAATCSSCGAAGVVASGVDSSRSWDAQVPPRWRRSRPGQHTRLLAALRADCADNLYKVPANIRATLPGAGAGDARQPQPCFHVFKPRWFNVGTAPAATRAARSMRITHTPAATPARSPEVSERPPAVVHAGGTSPRAAARPATGAATSTAATGEAMRLVSLAGMLAQGPGGRQSARRTPPGTPGSPTVGALEAAIENQRGLAAAQVLPLSPTVPAVSPFWADPSFCGGYSAHGCLKVPLVPRFLHMVALTMFRAHRSPSMASVRPGTNYIVHVFVS